MPEDSAHTRFKCLLDEAREVEKTKHHSKAGGVWVDHRAMVRWLTSVVDAVGAVYGKDRAYGQRLSTVGARRHVANWSEFLEALGVLEAAARDYEAGFAVELRELIAGDVFTDTLEMAQHLIDTDDVYRCAAASVAGGVLEGALRRLHEKHIGPMKGRPGLKDLNKALSEKGVYARPCQSEIVAWTDIRNDADHGHFDKVDACQVRRMIQGIRDFLARHLG